MTLNEKAATLGQNAGAVLRRQFGQESVLQQMERWQEDWNILQASGAKAGDHNNCFSAWLSGFYTK